MGKYPIPVTDERSLSKRLTHLPRKLTSALTFVLLCRMLPHLQLPSVPVSRFLFPRMPAFKPTPGPYDLSVLSANTSCHCFFCALDLLTFTSNHFIYILFHSFLLPFLSKYLNNSTAIGMPRWLNNDLKKSMCPMLCMPTTSATLDIRDTVPE